ncbi:uncharacterized protein LOC110241540, partial [Exaiptasia diaphana]|uniref:Uncharacterized protein n=1 Tax=Exaiptasia diaphana TaxID=2652724 RepID=A0A913XE36_EXADI
PEAASKDNNIHLWDVSGPREPALLSDDFVRDLDFSPDGRRIATVSSDGLHIWNSGTGKVLISSNFDEEFAESVRFSPNGELLANVKALAPRAYVWNASTGALVSNIRVIDTSGSSKDSDNPLMQVRLGFSPDSTYLFSHVETLGDERSETRSASVSTGEIVATLDRDWYPDEKFSCFDEDSLFVFKMSDSKSGSDLYSWKFLEGSKNKLLSYGSKMRSFTCSEGAKVIATVLADETVRIWSRQSNSRIFRYRSSVRLATLDQTGSFLATASSENEIHVWSLVDGEKTGLMSGHKEEIEELIFGPGGKLLLSVSNDRVRLWEQRDDGYFLLNEFQQWGLEGITAAKLDRSGTKLAIIDSDSFPKVWPVIGSVEEL